MRPRIITPRSRVASWGLVALLNLAALLSVSLGLINLVPVPMLDGGHLLFYAIEAVRGEPLSQRSQEFGLKIGVALVLALAIFVTRPGGRDFRALVSTLATIGQTFPPVL